jgi:hypothetical protein
MTYEIEMSEEDERLLKEGLVLVEMSLLDLKLLREAAGEFLTARGWCAEGVPAYVAMRYAGATQEEQERHVTRVTERVVRMLHIMERVLK